MMYDDDRMLQAYVTELEAEVQRWKNFGSSFLSPEMYGHAVNGEIRDHARRMLGIKPVEQAEYRVNG